MQVKFRLTDWRWDCYTQKFTACMEIHLPKEKNHTYIVEYLTNRFQDIFGHSLVGSFGRELKDTRCLYHDLEGETPKEIIQTFEDKTIEIYRILKRVCDKNIKMLAIAKKQKSREEVFDLG